MKKIRFMIPAYLFVLGCFLIAGIWGSRAITTISQQAPLTNRKCVIIDAGHGGVDGGATSCTGVLESHINLEIALRLEPLMNLLGIDTVMIRTTDCSIYTQGETIAAKKISDLKERVRIVNSANNAILVSIHQNHFTDEKYSGAQVFYAPTAGSQELAGALQSTFVKTINIGSKRLSKKASGVYLLQKIECTGVLIECGFLSNHEEEARLRDKAYQNKLISVIAAVCSTQLHGGQ